MRVLVLGATGMLGHVVAERLAEHFELHSGVRDTARAERLGIAGELHEIDAMRPEDVGALVRGVAPAALVNAIGLVKQLDEASRPLPAITVNSLLPHVLHSACVDIRAQLVHVSTDCVFSGTLPWPAAYQEDDLPDASDLYGRSKLLGEVTDAPGLTLRTSIIGPELERTSGLLEWFLSQSGGAVDGFMNAIFTGLTTTALAEIIERVLIDHPALAGLYQVAADPVSKYDLLIRLRDVLALDCDIRRVDEPRVNRALDGSRFVAATGIEVPSWDEMLAEYQEESHDACA